MAKNIVICSDGTGNSAAKLHGTNIRRIFEAVDLHNTSRQQVTYYDDGVGTDSLRFIRVLGGAFGLGLTRNILQAYAFLVMNYECGDKIFLFGFSRGAFTVRSLAGLIGRCGLIDRKKLIDAGSHRARTADLQRIMKAYRSTEVFRDLKGECYLRKEKRVRKGLGLCDLKPKSVPIHFIGVWDTVDAVGVPFDKIKDVISYVWARIFKQRLWLFKDLVPHPRVQNAYQALALDDERRTFHPILWEPQKRPSCNKRTTHIEQVWFSGMHADVGGGYARDELAHVSLNWMIEKAERKGLVFQTRKKVEFQAIADVHGHMHNSRTGIRMIYRPALRDPYSRPEPLKINDRWRDVIRCAARKIPRTPCTPVVHSSVLDRIQRRSNEYAPKILRVGNYSTPTKATGGGLKPNQIERLNALGLTHARLHMFFISLLGSLVVWAAAFTFREAFYSFSASIGRCVEGLGIMVPNVRGVLAKIGTWWEKIKENVFLDIAISVPEFANELADAIDSLLPNVFGTIVQFLVSNPITSSMVVTLIMLVWKANRYVEIETKVFAYRCWHAHGQDIDIDKPLECMDTFMRRRLLGRVPFLFMLVVLALGLGMAIYATVHVPLSVYAAICVVSLVAWKLRIFER